jgi:hypothetical protein
LIKQKVLLTVFKLYLIKLILFIIQDLQDITNQNLSKTEKALSYDSLYNYDDDIYQKKKLLNPLLNSNSKLFTDKIL